ncbi:MAG: hypothetical protein JW862_00340 [Anaerolineales bacterium]|nr:hypothetical protein [Anaerolineales bacterium]
MQPDTSKHIDPANYLRQDYQRWQQIYQVQTKLTQRFLDRQAQNITNGITQPANQIRFTLPDRVVCIDETEKRSDPPIPVPADAREQMAGGILERLSRTAIHIVLREKLDELEASANTAISISAGLTRFAVALYLVYTQLPAGRTIHYQAADGETIPSIPASDPDQPESAITETTDAIAEEENQTGGDTLGVEPQRGELQVPYVPAARRFFLPQWIAFDAEDRLLVGSLNEAEAHIHSMQQYLHLLHLAVSIAPYMIADELYQRKRYGILGQLVNQGRAISRFETQQIIDTIQKRAAENNLNRGLSLSLPYFDDQNLAVKTYDFQVIPAGRIMFIPAFVIRASRHEQVKVAQDTRLSPSTRNHLLNELEMLETAFLKD